MQYKFSKRADYFYTIFAPLMIFVSGFYNYATFHDYEITQPEFIIAATIVALSSLTAGLLLALAGPSNLRALGFAFILLVFFDIEFDFIKQANKFLAAENVVLLRYMILASCIFCIIYILLTIKSYLSIILFTIFLVTLLTAIILPVQKIHSGDVSTKISNPNIESNAPILHIILDGHIGIEGIPTDIDGGGELKQYLIDFYARWGFELYGSAYSKYILTHNSISNLLNGSVSKRHAELMIYESLNNKDGWIPKKNTYFKIKSEQGYNIRVYQSDYINYCAQHNNAIERCYTYPSSSPQLIKSLPLTISDKAELLLGSYFANRSYFHVINNIYDATNNILKTDERHTKLKNNYQFSSLSALDVFNTLNDDISSKSHGRLYFAHILFPHGPYVWDSSCRLRKDINTWLSRRENHVQMLTLSNPDYRASAYKKYFEQVRCATHNIEMLLRSMQRDGILDKAEILIHGDHGSRITIADPVYPMLEQLRERDYIDSFSTLFALRSPSTKPGYNRQQKSIQTLFSELVLGNESSDHSQSVYLLTGPVSKRLPFKEIPLPSF